MVVGAGILVSVHCGVVAAVVAGGQAVVGVRDPWVCESHDWLNAKVRCCEASVRKAQL